ncbi:heteromeric transposase endonuclease subunit TnsA [Cytobacillus praedii]|uniref:heteromeric transposase endonuclease subunit TnsA n=1 Tax=Cytobacillus praedii TaxID=1742358 RepID=UPI0007103514|nr:heteromeric transposase endonuclease subunit TnsA [Cytobacillus praedii]
MAKRSYSWTEEKIVRYQKEGRGSGELRNYKPWLTIHDVASKGNSSRIKGWKTGRIHHLLSNIERSYFYLLEWSEKVLDIREQFPLDRVETVDIANKKGIEHPKDPKTDTFIPMTTDFLVTIKRENKLIIVARSIKPFSKLEDERTIEKLEIEREYWEKKGVEWALVTEKEIPKYYANNIQWFHPFISLENPDDKKLAYRLLSYVGNQEVSNTLFDVFNKFEEDYLLDPGTAVNFLRYLLANKFILLNMDIKINLRSIFIQELSFNNVVGGTDEKAGNSG